jgi:hypothetical protein
MNVRIDPVTLEKIDAFRRRHRRLVAVRGFCALVSLWLGMVYVLALLDGLFVLPGVVRFFLIAAGHVAVGLGIWHVGVRQILRPPSRRRLARFIERSRPELRENLLSAVELGERGEAGEFGAILQRDVAEQVRDVPVGGALSWRRVGRWLAAAGFGVALCGFLLAVPGLRFDLRLRRALLPLANLERLSGVTIDVLAPDPADAVVPRGDGVTIRVSTSGPDHGPVTLELFPGDPVEMRESKDRVFETTVRVGREPVEFRVRAGDSMTRRYRLTPAARPEVVRFHKTIHWPAYARRPPTSAVEAHGRLEALEDSEAEVVFEADQEIRRGELHLELGGQATAVPLVPAGPRRLHGRIPIRASGTYRVHLVSAATGFENPESPCYEIHPKPDERPRVTLEEPGRDTTVGAGEVVALRGSAQDDVGLERVVRCVSVNKGEWKESSLVSEPPAGPVTISVPWDLASLGLRPGDEVIVKLAAIDLKGHRAESVPACVRIAQDTQSLSVRAQELAREAQRIGRAAEQLAAEDHPQAEVEKLAREQRDLNGRVREFREDLRRDAELQDPLSTEGRERIRDDLDAAGLLKDPPARVEEALDRAASARDRRERGPALARASEEEKKLAQALDQIGEHLRDRGRTRGELRRSEEATGLKEKFDRGFEELKKLAELAAQSPERQAAELEKELSEDGDGRRKLADLARQAMQRAERGLSEAKERPSPQDRARKVAEEPRPPTKDPDGAAADRLDEAAEEIQRAAKQMERLGSSEQARALEALASKTRQAAPREIGDLERDVSRARQELPSLDGSEKGGLADETTEHLARALDGLDRNQPAGEALAAAARAQARALGGGSKSGTTREERLLPPTPVDREWAARLPDHVARDLFESRREDIPAEYRQMVETYFKAVAERARGKK